MTALMQAAHSEGASSGGEANAKGRESIRQGRQLIGLTQAADLTGERTTEGQRDRERENRETNPAVRILR